MDFDLKASAKTYLETSDQLPKDYEEWDLARIVHMTVKVDLIHVENVNESLAEFCLDDGEQGAWLFQQVIESDIHDKRQIYAHVNVRMAITSLPVNLEVSTPSDLPHLNKPSSLFMIRGQLVALSQPLQCTLSSRFSCREQDCQRQNKFVDIANPATSNFSKKCVSCQNILAEIIEAREVGQYVNADFVLVKNSLDSHVNFANTFLIKDGDIPILELGQTFEVIGKVVLPKKVAGFYECVSLQPFSSFVSRAMSSLSYRGSLELSPDLLQMKGDSQSPWTFVHKLALHFGSHVAPPGTFHALKTSILLSLASTKTEETNALPLFVGVLDESDFPEKLLRYGLDLAATKPMIHSVVGSTALTSNLTKDGKVEAGSLILARDTICYLGEMVKFKKAELDTIKTVLEQNQIPIKSVNKDVTDYVPLRSTMWAHCSIYGTKAGRRQDQQQKIRSFCSAMKPFIDVFGTVFICSEEPEITKDLVKFVLGMGQEESTPLKGLIEFLTQVREQRLPLDAEAETLLKKYFVASRRSRVNDSIRGTEFPHTALSTIRIMAEAYARLSLNGDLKTTVFDAVAAIKLFEHNMASQCGYSHLEVQPQQHYLQRHDDEQEPREIGREMLDFWKRLQVFVKQFAGDLEVTIDNSEE